MLNLLRRIVAAFFAARDEAVTTLRYPGGFGTTRFDYGQQDWS